MQQVLLASETHTKQKTVIPILVAKNKCVHLILSSSPLMYSFRILRYSVLCLVVSLS